MKQTKSFIVEGDVKTYNGKRIHNIAERTDETVNSFLGTLEGELIDIKITPVFSGSVGDTAFVTVVFDAPKKAVEQKKSK